MSEPGQQSPGAAHAGSPPASLLGDADTLGYGPGPVWDEMVTGGGRLRTHWQFLIGRLAELEPAELGELRDEAGRLFRQNGVAYTIYGDPKGAERPWPLDLIPLLIPAEEWELIAAGARQRARLLNAALADIYGQQSLIAARHLPGALLHANPNFLRPACGIAPPGGIYLHLYAIDLARSPDGQWWVLADRMQAPSGAGYALENRSVVGRVLAQSHADGVVEPIAPFFAQLRDNLGALAPPEALRNGRQPRLVILTPGPYNETYFEHAYLARQLGVTLVEGGDLTVRDRRVFLKTLSALEPVDVVLRRLDDDFCDPLELRADSALGVAGLTEAARAGTVTIANALGSGVLEAMAFKPFLPGLAEALLGEKLQLPDVASWWCGGPKERRYVLEHLRRLVIKPAFPALGWEPIFGAGLTEAERQALAARITDRPWEFVGQERVELSTVPVQVEQRLVPRHLVLRIFVAATSDGFAVMPGGLTRTAPSHGGPIVSMQRGGGCKDTWVVGSQRSDRRRSRAEPNVVSLRHASERRPAAGELPSRAADGLFWVGRYAERAAGVIRLLRTLLLGITDAARPWTMHEVEPLLTLAMSLDLIPPLDLGGWRSPALHLIPLVQTALADPGHPNGAVASLGRLAHAASGVRDRLPPDCMRIVAALARDPGRPLHRPAPARLLLRLDELVMMGAALWGAVEDTMPRDAGWHFLEIGKLIERAINLIAIIRSTAETALKAESETRPIEEDRLLAAMLAAASIRTPVAARPDGTLDRRKVLAAVLADETDPFSAAFQIGALSRHLKKLPLPGSDGGDGRAGAIAQALELAQTARATIAKAVGSPPAGNRASDVAAGTVASLQDALAPVDTLLPEISNLLTEAYFIHVFARPA